MPCPRVKGSGVPRDHPRPARDSFVRAARARPPEIRIRFPRCRGDL